SRGANPTAWLDEAKITRGTPARRAASKATYVPWMLSWSISSQGASVAMAARWITAAAPRHAAVIASRSVIEAWTTSSAGPRVGAARSSGRGARGGRPGRGPSRPPPPPGAGGMGLVAPPANFGGAPPRRAGGARPAAGYWGLGSGSAVAPGRDRNSKSQPSLA